MEDLLDAGVLRERLERLLPDKNLLLAAMGADARSRSTRSSTQALGLGRAARAAPRRRRRGSSRTRCARGDHVLLEGAQGTLLDLDHGSLPVRDLVEPGRRRRVHRRRDRAAPGRRGHRRDEGVLDPRSARGRSRPSCLDEIGAGIAERGHEVGTDDRPAAPRRLVRRGAAALRRRGQQRSAAIMLNKLDILSGVDPIRLCVAYEIDGRRVEALAVDRRALLGARRRSTSEFDGWAEPIHAVRSLGDLPENARRYVTALEEHAGVPIVLVSVGPERTQTIERAWRPMRHRAAVAA